MARIAMIVGQDFEDSEMKVPLDRLRQEGHEVVLVGEQAGAELRGKKGRETITIDRSIDDVSADEFDALVIPGGYSPDHLRTNPRMVRFTMQIANHDKPVAAICHAGSMLIEADLVDGRTVTSWPSIRTDLINAGARWVDREVVEDAHLITSRKPDDLDAFVSAILRQLAEISTARGRTAPAGQPAQP
jgi:protease I